MGRRAKGKHVAVHLVNNSRLLHECCVSQKNRLKVGFQSLHPNRRDKEEWSQG